MARATTFRPHLTALEDRANPTTAVFNPFTHVLTITGTEGHDSIKLSVADGNILLNDAAIAGSPTVATTDSIHIATGDNIEHNDEGGVSGTNSPDDVTLDWSGGVFAPGYTAEPSGLSEIEITMDPGRFWGTNAISWEDFLILRGGAEDDQIDIGRARGSDRINLNGDNDADIQLLDYYPAHLSINATRIKVYTGAGDDQVNAAGGPVVGAAYTGWNLSGFPDTGLSINGDTGDDVLIGGAKDTRIIGGPGNDQLIGGPSWDWFEGGDGHDYLFGGAGSDFLIADRFDPTPRSVGGNDILIGGDDPDYLRGGGGDDVLLGGGGGDEMDGGAGSDQLFGQAGDDWMFGEAGSDLLFGGAGDDELSGDNGHDELSGGDGMDILNGGAGDDDLSGDAGNDLLVGGVGRDLLTGGSGDDLIAGGDGHDTLLGGSGNDYLSGGEGDDSLNGGQGADTLYGGADDDTLDGGADSAVDVLLGGSGRDGFRFRGGEIEFSDFDPFDPDYLLP
jgi:Ca2+-binding RTX toxin-like protein